MWPVIRDGKELYSTFYVKVLTRTSRFVCFSGFVQLFTFLSKFSLRTADTFPVVASLPSKNSVCEPERQNDFREIKPFFVLPIFVLIFL